MESVHNRKFVPSGVALVFGRLKNALTLMPQDPIEQLIIQSNFLKDAPFLWIGLTYRYGIQNNLKVEFQKISKKYGDLSVAIELDMEILKWSDQNNLQLLSDILTIAALESIIQIGQKYKIETTIFNRERSKYGNIPSTIQECKNYLHQTDC